jgi:hypothetical protein
MSLAVPSGMTQPRRPHWPSDDQVREQRDHEEFTGDGRKLIESPRVGGLAPDADPEGPPASPRRRSR